MLIQVFNIFKINQLQLFIEIYQICQECLERFSRLWNNFLNERKQK